MNDFEAETTYKLDKNEVAGIFHFQRQITGGLIGTHFCTNLLNTMSSLGCNIVTRGRV